MSNAVFELPVGNTIITLYEDGMAKVDYGYIGKTVNLLENAASMEVFNDANRRTMEERYLYEQGSLESSQTEQIERYIQLLCMVNESGHSVNQELTEAIAKYREAAGV